MRAFRPDTGCVLVCTALITFACGNERATAPRPTAVTEPLVRAVSGVELPELAMQAKLAGVARRVALALQDSALRRLVFDELHASTSREHKLHFGPFLRARGGPLLDRMAHNGRLPADAVLSSLDSVVDVEFYMPVREHFASWRGDENLIVVSQLSDSDDPVGFTLTGQPVAELSAETPPATPVLVIVPVESDFSVRPVRAEACPECPPGGGGGGSGGDGGASSAASELWMVEAEFEDNGEGWPRGSPELVVSTVQVYSNGAFQVLHCAHEDQGDLRYRWDGNSGWAGEVLITPLSDLHPTNTLDPRVGILIYENDDDGSLCAYSPDNWWDNFPGQMQRASSNDYRADWQRVEQDANGDGVVDGIVTFLGYLIAGSVLDDLVGNGDDLVGLSVLATGSSGFQDPKNIVRFLEACLPAGNGWVRFQLR